MAGVAARLAARPGRVPPAHSQGVVIAGDVTGANGLAESARILHHVIAAHGFARGFIPLGLPSVVPANQAPVPADAALIAVVNAPVLPVGLLRYPKSFLRGRRVIGLWAWELPVVPANWRHGVDFVHEVWVPSTFCAAAVEPIAPGRVRVVPHPLAAVPLPVEGDRASLALPADQFIVLTVFNLASSMARKNPLGCIAAFKAAFGASRNHLFILKLSGVEAYAEDVKLIQAAIGDASNIRLLTATLPEPRLRGLIAASDVVMSLHRSEGFGLIPATAMLLGRPALATAWSGNLDFMAPDSAALVSYRLVPPADPRGVYAVPGAAWAEPDVEDAATWLRRLADDSTLRHRMGDAGRVHARAALGAAPVLAGLAANGITTAAPAAAAA